MDDGRKKEGVSGRDKESGREGRGQEEKRLKYLQK